VVLRLGGGKSFAAELAPALARGYFESLDLADVNVEKPDPNHATISGERAGVRVAITVEGMNTPDGFDQLGAGKLDVAMSGRRIKPEWQARLDAHGSLMVPGREHVVALSGIAVIVNPANPIPQLTRDELADIFTGAVTDWSAVGGRKGPIHVYAGDEKMGLTDLFRTLVLQKREYGPEVKRLAMLQELSDQVALDPQGIAYVTLPFVRSARAVPLAEADAAALVPNAFTLATEDYLLTHRVYFYALPRPDAPHLLKFLQFALGPEGQAIVKRSGFVELSVATAPREPPRGAPPRFVKLTGGAHRLSSTFRFEPGASDFDVRALADVERVTGYLVENRLNGQAIRLLGFADAQGKREVNLALSQARAAQVARALAQRGVTGVAVEGFGAALPVATNATADGRERNRRVEVWVAR
jgi:phosphate transport system substrate-binding protein